MKKLVWIALASILLFFVGCKTKELSPNGQAKQDELMRKIENRDFIFNANSAQPMRGRNVNLTGNYSLKVGKDTISSDLPYFGQSYNAPMNPTELGVKFRSTNFDYQIVSKKNNMFEILIVPKDISNSDLRGIKLNLSAGASGYGSLRILFSQRQSISYSGTIE